MRIIKNNVMDSEMKKILKENWKNPSIIYNIANSIILIFITFDKCIWVCTMLTLEGAV